MGNFFIYGLADPRTKIIRYVGQTNNLKKRYQAHMAEARNRKQNVRSHKNCWIRSIDNDGLEPVMILLAETETREECNEAEVEIIALLKDSGFDLTNQTTGGDGAYTKSLESIERWKESFKGFKHSEESKKKSSASHKQRFIDNPELRESMRGRNPNLPPNDRKGEEMNNSKLTDEIVTNIRKQMNNGVGIAEVASQYPGVTMQCLQMAASGKTWAHVSEPPYTPKNLRKISDQDRLDILELLSKGELSQGKIAKLYNVQQSAISKINVKFKSSHLK